LEKRLKNEKKRQEREATGSNFSVQNYKLTFSNKRKSFFLSHVNQKDFLGELYTFLKGWISLVKKKLYFRSEV